MSLEWPQRPYVFFWLQELVYSPENRIGETELLPRRSEFLFQQGSGPRVDLEWTCEYRRL